MTHGGPGCPAGDRHGEGRLDRRLDDVGERPPDRVDVGESEQVGRRLIQRVDRGVKPTAGGDDVAAVRAVRPAGTIPLRHVK